MPRHVWWELPMPFAAAGLAAILIGNAGAALHGAPVTTIDFDFLYRGSRANEGKLRKVAELLHGSLAQPFPGLSTMYRIRRARPQLQVDLTDKIHGVRSFNSLRSRAARVELEGRVILVASLPDIIRSNKKPTGRKIRRCCMSSKKPSTRPAKSQRKPTKRERELELMRQASEQALVDMIRANLALPMNQRTHFLRLRLPNGGSCL